MEYFVTDQKDGKFSVTFDWADGDKYLNHDYSLKLSKYPIDPGPLVDTSRSTFTFKDVSAGTYSLSMKTKLIGSWTEDYIYWDKIDVSSKTAGSTIANFLSYPTQQLPKEQSQITSLEAQVTSLTKEKDSNHTWAIWSSIIAAGFAYAYAVKAMNS